MSRLNAMKEQYTNNSIQKKAKTKSAFNPKKYFNTFLPEGVNSAKRTIRIVEPKGETESPFVEVIVHKKQIGNKWPTYMCPNAYDGSPCPFCEGRKLLLALGADGKEQAKELSQRKVYIAKVIDRDAEHEGVKFWRFNHHYKNAGTFDKIDAANSGLPEGEDPYSSLVGRDINITVTKDGKNSIVSGINYSMIQTPLSTDDTLQSEWLDFAHKTNWDNGFWGIKPYDFLEIIVRGGKPKWVKNEDGTEGGHHIDETLPETTAKTNESVDNSELDMGLNSNKTATESVVPESVVPESVVPESAVPESVVPESAKEEEEEEDDLPF